MSQRKTDSYYRCLVTATPETLRRLRELSATGSLSADHMMVRAGTLTIVLHSREIERLRAEGMEIKVGDDLLKRAKRVQAETVAAAPLTEADGLLTGFVSSYLDANGILARFATLHTEFPAITQWTDLPHPTLGYDGSQAGLAGPATIKMFRINTTPASTAKPGMLVIAGIHAREWIPPLAAIEFASQLLKTYTPGSTNPAVQAINQLVEELDIIIVPALNPDGINFSHHDFAMWRKNRRHNTPPPMPCAVPAFDHNGVDNNRNYSIFWGDSGSSGDVCSDSFRGPSAFSERENQNIRWIVEQFPNLLTAMDCHSFGEDIFRAHATEASGHPAPVEPRDHNIFLGLEAAMNAAISGVTPGKTYSTGTTNNFAGTGDDYLFLAHRIFGFTLECAQDFQPAIATALVTVQEVAAALRAVAAQTRTLAAQFTFPVNLVHVLDRSGSMVASGYVEPTKNNARRMIDLMSLNDSVGVVSFNQTATTHLGLTAINNPGVYATARAAVDAIAFNGLTSIGAGLQAAGAALAPATGPKAIILLSDGYQNRAPMAETVLPTLPAGTKVNTIALGPQSDQMLLETIAATTGGNYYFSPDELTLHEIYNFVRADATEEDLAMNESANMGSSQTTMTKQVVVDEGAATALFSVAWNNPQISLRVSLRPPNGPVMDLSRVRNVAGRACHALRLRRPQAGVWTLIIERAAGQGAVNIITAAFLRSHLRLRLVAGAKNFIVGQPLSLLAQVREQGRPLSEINGSAIIARPAGSLNSLLADWKKTTPQLPNVPKVQLNAPDALPKAALQALLIRQRLTTQTQQDPLRYLHSTAVLEKFLAESSGSVSGHLQESGLLAGESFANLVLSEIEAAIFVVRGAKTTVAGTHNVLVQITGRSQVNGSVFSRVALRSLFVS